MLHNKVILLLVFPFYCSFLFSQSLNNLHKLSEGLKNEWLKKEKTEVIIQFHDQKIDLSSYRSSWDKSQKGSFIFKALQENARISQYTVQKWLTDKGISSKSNMLVNALLVTLSKEQITYLAKRPDIAFIYDNPDIFVTPYQRSTENQSLRSASEWGIDKIKAPAVWAMGITGKGIVIAGQDTGYDWAHPDLVSAYRGSSKETITHDYHWFDAIDKASPLNKDTINPCGYSIKIPCDDDVHGTHTMGTMVGQDVSGTSI
ncbi:MAG: hypothetical protein NWR22_03885, partial [Saprospiraceae bacterium]|nr:hypothetical protein [Saprospiraceae bacterium]